MLKRTLLSTMLISLIMGLSYDALANSLNVHGGGAIGLASMGSYQYLNLGVVTDLFNTSNSTKAAAVWGYGIGYQWDKLINNRPISLGLDVTGYYTQYKSSGVQTPAINLISGADSLNYSAKETSLAWMIESRLISTQYSWQPYVMSGIGVSTNKMSNYNEYPSSPASSAVATNAFTNHTSTNFAWEAGVGVQRTIYMTKSGNSLMLAGEYRYMDWGPMVLGQTAAQTTQQRLNLGHLQTNIFDLRLSLQF